MAKNNKLSEYALGGVFEGYGTTGDGGGYNYKKARRKAKRAARKRKRKCGPNSISCELNKRRRN
jgi:hypothetical protein